MTGWRVAWQRHRPLALIVLGMLSLRAGLLLANAVPFNSDEAVVALMARHILRGERPIFFYGQAYLGSLDAWLVAAAFRVWGESVLAVRVVQITLYAATLVSAYAVALQLSGERWLARCAALWLALPPVVMTLYTTASLGGYGEALLLGNLLWLAALYLGQRPESWQGWTALGALTGLGLWVFPLTGVYALPAWGYGIWAQRRMSLAPRVRRWVVAALSGALGAGPWLWFTLANGPATLAEMGGSAVAGVSGGPWLAATGQHLLSLILFAPTVIAGLRPSWGITLLALPFAPLAVAVYSAALMAAAGRWRRAWPTQAGAGLWLLGGTSLTLGAAFVFTPFGADPSGRYFLPLMVVLALGAAGWLAQLRRRRRWLAHGLALSLLAFNFWGTVQSAAALPGLTTQFDPVAQVDQRALPELIAFLRAHGETRGYTNYWVAFPLAFASQEELIFTARLPYHEDFRYTPRDDRYLPYQGQVAASARVAYITTRHPALDEYLRARLSALGVAYQEQRLGDFQVFYALSRKVTPPELGLE